MILKCPDCGIEYEGNHSIEDCLLNIKSNIANLVLKQVRLQKKKEEIKKEKIESIQYGDSVKLLKKFFNDLPDDAVIHINQNIRYWGLNLEFKLKKGFVSSKQRNSNILEINV